MKKQVIPYEQRSFHVDVPNRYYHAVDSQGNEIHPGQFIVYSASAGRSSVMKFGKVVEIVPVRPEDLEGDKWDMGAPIKVRSITLDLWGNEGQKTPDHRTGSGDQFDIQNNGHPVLLAMTCRIIIVDAASLRKEVVEKLDELHAKYITENAKPA